MLVDTEQQLEEDTVECSARDILPCYGECAARAARLNYLTVCNGTGLYTPASSSRHNAEPTQTHKFSQRSTPSILIVVVILSLSWLCRVQRRDLDRAPNY